MRVCVRVLVYDDDRLYDYVCILFAFMLPKILANELFVLDYYKRVCVHVSTYVLHVFFTSPIKTIGEPFKSLQHFLIL